MTLNAYSYGFGNARVRALKAQMLPKEKLEEMVKAPSVGSLIATLSDSAYSQELVELSLEYNGGTLVEAATARRFSKVSRKILDSTPKSGKGVVRAALSKWDVHNLRIILLAKHLKKPDEEARRWFIPAGGITANELEGILKQETIADIVNYIGNSSYGHKLRENLQDYERRGEINALLSALDFVYLMGLADAVRKTSDRLVSALLSAEVDAGNIMVALRCKNDGSIPDEKILSYVVPAGGLRKDDISAILSAKDWIDEVSKLRHYELQKAAKEYRNDGLLSHFEARLEDDVMRHATMAFYGSVLSLGVMVGFIFIMGDELRKIRKIVRGKEYNLGEDRLREMVFKEAG